MGGGETEGGEDGESERGSGGGAGELGPNVGQSGIERPAARAAATVENLTLGMLTGPLLTKTRLPPVSGPE